MSNSYSISSQNTANPFNALMATVAGASGEAKLAIKPIEQYCELTALAVPANIEKFLDLSAIKFDYIVRLIYWANIGATAPNSDVIFKIYDGTTLIARFDINASFLNNGYQPTIFPLSSAAKVSVTSDFLIDRLVFILEPALIIDKIRV